MVGVLGDLRPSRRWSAFITKGSWPKTTGDDARELANQRRRAARELEQYADNHRYNARQFRSESGGEFAEAWNSTLKSAEEDCLECARWMNDSADICDEMGNDIDRARSRIEHLDFKAHQELDELKAAGTLTDAAELAVVTDARRQCMEEAVSTKAILEAYRPRIAAAAPAVVHTHARKPSGPNYQTTPYIEGNGKIFAAGEGDNGTAPGRGGPGGKQAGDPGQESPGEGNEGQLAPQSGPAQGKDKTPQRGGGKPDDGSSGVAGTPGAGSVLGGLSPLSGASLPGGGSSGGGGLGSAGGLGSGLFGGASSPLSGLQSGGLGQGLPGAGTSGLGQVSPAGGGAGLAPAAFSQGVNAGLAGSPVVSSPSATPAPGGGGSPVMGSGAGSPLGSAPGVGPAGGAGSPPPAAAGGMAPAMGPLSGAVAPPPAASGAGLAPVGADALRHGGAGSAPAPSSPSAGAGGASAGGSSGAASSSMAATPIAAAGARESRRDVSRREADMDPVLAGAARMVYELLHASRVYETVDWCVGVFGTPGGPMETVVTSNEGAGYVPAGVFVARAARLLFADPLVDNVFRDRWMGWSNPVATMVAYAQLREGRQERTELYAVAASSMMGGPGLAPAEQAGVPHMRLCSPAESPLRDVNTDQVLDSGRLHRLGLVDPGLLAWLDDPDRTPAELVKRCGELTAQARDAVNARLAETGMDIPNSTAEVFRALKWSETISEDFWDKLLAEMRDARGMAAAMRRDEDSPLPVEYYRAHHDLARLAECLFWWRPRADDDAQAPSIRYAEIAYCARQIIDRSEVAA